MGNILSLQRNGLHDNNTYDVIDDLSYTYNGNQVIKIDDDAVDPVYNGCFNFKDGADEDIEYEYDQNGNLTMDLNREICSIAYNCLNLPQRIDYQDGSYVLYTYNAGGHKLRTDYYINPLPNMVPQVNGGTGMNRNANLQHTRVDYSGGAGKGPVKENSIHININPSLSPTGAAETFSHEGYGYTLIYVRTNGDRNMAVHHYLAGCKEGNRLLVDYTIRARKETVKNIMSR